jgi:hypothetical protein
LAAAVVCSGDFATGTEPVLLVPGTGFDYKSQYSWSWGPALTRSGIPWCAVSPPYSQLGDLTIAGEYDAYAIRHTYHLAGDRKIAVVGHSQGGMQPRWALRFWPDTRDMVEDYVGVAPDSQGLDLSLSALAPALSSALCSITGCAPALWQQVRGSQFMQALNSGQQTFAGIDYSVVYSKTDIIVVSTDTPLEPAAGASYRRAALQDVCPSRLADHLSTGTSDAVAWAMVLDAITRPGPVDPTRVDPAVCSRVQLPGMTLLAAINGAVAGALQVNTAVATAPRAFREPDLPAYVFTS